MLNDAFKAGLWASVGSTLGKLAGTPSITGDSYIIWTVLLITMILANTWGCRYYLHSLDSASNSVAPTVISAASSYVLSGFIGVSLFDEGASVRWWIGAGMILLGLSLVAQSKNKNKKDI